MSNDIVLRQQLVTLLTSGEAHASFDKAIDGLPADLRGRIPEGAEHSPWQLLEHMRIALLDIYEFSTNPAHKSPKWPEAYWPKSASPANEEDWDKSVTAFRALIQRMGELVSDKNVDLFAKIPHGDGQTILREALLVADHNAYHIGQLVTVRKLLSSWT